MGGGRSDSGSLMVLCNGWPTMEITFERKNGGFDW